jgi:phosphoribosylglycinamide formyltransferase-1
MYGAAVHEAVLASGETETGVTVHVVDDRYDHGPIVAQNRVTVLPSDDVDQLSRRVLEREHEIFVETLQGIESGEIDLDQLAG